MKHIKEFNEFYIKEEAIYQDDFDILILKDINDELKKDDIITIKEIIDHHIFITDDDVSFSIKNYPEFEYWKEIEVDDEDDEDINSTFSKMKNKI